MAESAMDRMSAVTPRLKALRRTSSPLAAGDKLIGFFTVYLSRLCQLWL